MKTKIAVFLFSFFASSACFAQYVPLPKLGCTLAPRIVDASATYPDISGDGIVTVGSQSITVSSMVVSPGGSPGALACGGTLMQQSSAPFAILGNALLRPANGDPLEVTVKCFASKDGQDPLEIIKRALFKVNNIACVAGAGFTGGLKKAKDETIISNVPPALFGADFSIDAGTGFPPGGGLGVVSLTLHGSPGDTLHWSCTYNYYYFQAPRAQVDPATCLAIPTP
jgi:hypothetical protein